MHNSILLYSNDIREKGPRSPLTLALRMWTLANEDTYLGQGQINWMIGNLNSVKQLAKSNKRGFNRDAESALRLQKAMAEVHEVGHIA